MINKYDQAAAFIKCFAPKLGDNAYHQVDLAEDMVMASLRHALSMGFTPDLLTEAVARELRNWKVPK